jgi:hypothetical protein
MTITNASLNDIGNNITATGGALAQGEADVVAMINGITGGGELTQTQLIKLQWNISRYTITASVFGNIMKEFADSLKQGANRLS